VTKSGATICNRFLNSEECAFLGFYAASLEEGKFSEEYLHIHGPKNKPHPETRNSRLHTTPFIFETRKEFLGSQCQLPYSLEGLTEIENGAHTRIHWFVSAKASPANVN
jgi:hypothetical protein